MKNDQMHLINKIFNSETIRTIWDKEKEKYYISIVDMIGVLTESNRPRKYWNDLKNQLIDEGNQLSEKIGQLKLRAEDGKYRLTDVCDIEEMFRIIESIPSKNAEPIKRWLAKLGSERIDETFDPSLAVQRAIDIYRAKGYDEEWITKRNKNIQDRKKLIDVWNDGGITKDIEFAILTNEIYQEWSGMTAKGYKEFKGLKKESLRDNMSDIEMALVDISEIATRELAKEKKPIGLEENKVIAKIGGHTAKVTRDYLEEQLGKSIITNNNQINYQTYEIINNSSKIKQ